MRRERISNLPSEVIDHILSYLPIRDAARTSILSSEWRYRFAMLPRLVFDHRTWDTNITFEKVVDHVLLGHIGTIHTFSVTHFYALANWDMDRWILVLSRSSIKEFMFGVGTPYPYKMPSCFYSFHDLTHLTLINCLISKPPAPTFKGFRRLKSLYLGNVTFLGQDVVEALLAGSPLLETLIMIGCLGFTHLKINAANLKFLHVDEDVLEKFALENTFIIASVIVDSCTSASAFCFHVNQMRSCEEFAAGRPFQNMCILRISVGLANVEAILSTLCLLRSFPHLQALKISAFQEDQAVAVEEGNNSLSNDGWTNCQFAQLLLAEISGISGVKAEVDFIKLLLSSSPVLQRMVVQPASLPASQMLVKALSQFKGASADAVIKILDP